MSLRDGFAPCPDCDGALDPRGSRLICVACDAVLVSHVELAEMLRELQPDELRALDEQLVPSGDGVRACPRCASLMDRVTLGTVILDRCRAHGIWFDPDELARVLGGGAQAIASFQQSNERRNAAANLLESSIGGRDRTADFMGTLSAISRWLWPWKSKP